MKVFGQPLIKTIKIEKVRWIEEVSEPLSPTYQSWNGIHETGSTKKFPADVVLEEMRFDFEKLNQNEFMFELINSY